jgi:hypothetical protein
MFSSGVGMQPPYAALVLAAATQPSRVIVAMSLGRGELQHRLEGEAAPAVDCRCVCRVAEFGL